jgi:DNA-binding NarL/FixJ family response regulator
VCPRNAGSLRSRFGCPSVLLGLSEAEVFERMTTKIMLVDDHRIMREGIKRFLQNSTDLIVTGEADSGADCLRLCEVNKPDVVVMAIGLPDLSGIEVTAKLSRLRPEIKVLILSMYDDQYSVLAAIEAGARGFVLKRASDSGELRDAIHTVASGGFHLSPQVADNLFMRIRAGGPDSQANTPVMKMISARERQVFLLVAEGKTNKEIAVLLQLALHTVRSYRKSLMTKLEVHNVASLTRLALASGLVHRPTPVAETRKKWES